MQVFVEEVDQRTPGADRPNSRIRAASAAAADVRQEFGQEALAVVLWPALRRRARRCSECAGENYADHGAARLRNIRGRCRGDRSARRSSLMRPSGVVVAELRELRLAGVVAVQAFAQFRGFGVVERGSRSGQLGGDARRRKITVGLVGIAFQIVIARGSSRRRRAEVAGATELFRRRGQEHLARCRAGRRSTSAYCGRGRFEASTRGDVLRRRRADPSRRRPACCARSGLPEESPRSALSSCSSSNRLRASPPISIDFAALVVKNGELQIEAAQQLHEPLVHERFGQQLQHAFDAGRRRAGAIGSCPLRSSLPGADFVRLRSTRGGRRDAAICATRCRCAARSMRAELRPKSGAAQAAQRFSASTRKSKRSARSTQTRQQPLVGLRQALHVNVEFALESANRRRK